MKLNDYPGTSGLRFDGRLAAFDKLVSLFLSAPDRAKSSGKKVVAKGMLSPSDIIYASGAMAYDICTHETIVQSVLYGRSVLSQRAIEAGMSPDLSPWVLTMLGASLNGKSEVALDAYSTACGDGFDDQITKSFQVMAQAHSLPLRFWEVPRYDPETEHWALSYLKSELEQFFEWMAKQFGQVVTESSLQHAIHLGNLLRQDMVDLCAFLAGSVVPIPALEYYLVQMMMGDYAQDPEELHALYSELLHELSERVNRNKEERTISDTPKRVYILGDEMQELSVLNAIEDNGGVLVGSDFRLALYYELVDEKLPPLDSLARWIWHMPNNLPTIERIRFELPFIERQKPDAIILSSVVGSRTSSETEKMVKDLLLKALRLPVLCIETALPHETTDKAEYQIQAFLDIIRGEPR